jgi:hypothetical protein
MTGFGVAPPDCDAELFGNAPTVLDGRCRCLVCGRCGHHTGNASQGHYWAWCKVTHSIRKHHFCCQDPVYGCSLEATLVEGGEPQPERPPMAALWDQAGGDPDEYRRLLREHGYTAGPGDEGYDPGSRTLPCGWSPP